MTERTDMELMKRLYFAHLFISLIPNTFQEDFRLEDKRNGMKINKCFINLLCNSYGKLPY